MSYFSLSAIRRVISILFLTLCPAAIVQHRDSICPFVLLQLCLASYRRHRSSIALFYGRLFAHKRTVTNATDYLSSKGKLDEKILPRWGGHGSQKKKRGSGREWDRERGGKGGKPAEPTRNTNYNALRTIALNLLDALFRSLNGIKSGNEVCRRVSRPRLRIVRIYHFLFLAPRPPPSLIASLNYCTYFAKLPSAFQFPFSSRV